jgi:hypothetical protein
LTVGDVEYYVSSQWETRKTEKFKYYYLEKGDSLPMVMVYNDSLEADPTEANLEAVYQGMLGGFDDVHSEEKTISSLNGIYGYKFKVTGVLPDIGTVDYYGFFFITDKFGDQNYYAFVISFKPGTAETKYAGFVDDFLGNIRMVDSSEIPSDESSDLSSADDESVGPITDNDAPASGNQQPSRDISQEGSASQTDPVSMAKSYLNTLAFSRQGLIEQLEFEGFSNADAVYGADNSGADWNEQAVKCAKSYLDYLAFSRQELIEQLEFEGFTHEQAVHGVNANGL